MTNYIYGEIILVELNYQHILTWNHIYLQ